MLERDTASIPDDEDEDRFDDDENDAGFETDEQAEDAFLKTLLPDEGDEATDETSAPKSAAEDEPATEPVFAADDHVVTVKVGEEEHKVAVKDLKRLFGQEASLTQKSQEASALRDTARARVDAAQATIDKALALAEKRFEPYTKLDFLVLSKELDGESLRQLREDARAAYEDLEALKAESTATRQAAQQIDAEAVRQEAAKAVETLRAEFPKVFQTEWSEDVYNETWRWAAEQGLAEAGQITNPTAIILMRKAMLYDRGLKMAKEKVQKVAEQPRKPLRNNSAPAPSRGRGREDALARLRRSGSDDDAQDAFLASFRRDDD